MTNVPEDAVTKMMMASLVAWKNDLCSGWIPLSGALAVIISYVVFDVHPAIGVSAVDFQHREVDLTADSTRLKLKDSVEQTPKHF
jgi:hypothetical protein